MVRPFTHRDYAIVTTDAGATHLHMIHRTALHRGPQGWKLGMTGAARIAAGHVRRTLTTRLYPVMTGDAVANKATVIHRRGNPGQYAMATIAGSSSRYVGGMFTGGDHPIMATGTNPNHFVMIHRIVGHWHPRHRPRCMTVRTVTAALDVSRGFAGGHHAVVATDAVTLYLCMIHCRAGDRRPRDWATLVTGLALIGTADVVCQFTRCRDPIMTANTGANDIVVVDCCR